MGAVTDFADSLWDGTQDTQGVHPFTNLLGLEAYGEGLAFVSSFANVVVLDTREGALLIDTGSFFMASQNFNWIRAFTRSPVHTAVYTHGHVDHAFGLGPFEAEAAERGWARTEVIAHTAVADRFERYRLTAGYNLAINRRQFGHATWPQEYREPDRTYATRLSLTLGGERVELRHARGETDDHTWVWLPERKVLCTGDLFIWASPNCGNPQKVQRFPREWAKALRDMAALGAELLFPGHGPPIRGADRVKLALEETAQLLESLLDQTLELMNAGRSLDEIVHTVRAPEGLLARPYLRPVYDEPEFIVRNLWRLYGGWWDGNPAHLKPAPEAALALELASLAGGAPAVAERARVLTAQGELRLACHLIEIASRAAPNDAAITALRSDIYTRRAEAETSLMAKGVYGAAAQGR